MPGDATLAGASRHRCTARPLLFAGEISPHVRHSHSYVAPTMCRRHDADRTVGRDHDHRSVDWSATARCSRGSASVVSSAVLDDPLVMDYLKIADAPPVN